MVWLKKNRLNSIFGLTCPRCQNAPLFKNKNAYHPLSESIDMPESCSNCSLKFEKETGFYYGAMYVSYGLNVALSAGLFWVYYLFFWQSSLHWYLILDFIVILATFPLISRISRAIWINLFYHYQEPGTYEQGLPNN